MEKTSPTAGIAELLFQRRLLVSVAAVLVIAGFALRYDRATFEGPKPADKAASAFAAIVPPAPEIGAIANVGGATPRRASRARNGGSGDFTPSTETPANEGGGFVGGPAAPVELASVAGPSTLGFVPAGRPGGVDGGSDGGFVGLPGGGVIGVNGPVAPGTPTDPGTNNPGTPTGPGTPTDPGANNPGTPTDPGNTTDPGGGLPDPGPGAVPEPATWALMILGIGALGVSMRRRRADDTAQESRSVRSTAG